MFFVYVVKLSGRHRKGLLEVRAALIETGKKTGSGLLFDEEVREGEKFSIQGLVWFESHNGIQ